MNGKAVVRRANLADMGALHDICRESFPHRARWQGPKLLGLRWLRIALTSTAVEIWVSLLAGKVVGFAVIITDEAKWAKKKRERRGPLIVWLLALLTHPKLVVSQIMKKGRAIRLTRSKAAPTEGIPSEIGKRTWIEAIAISPQMRGQGLGKQMLQVCEARTRDHRRENMVLNVDQNNITARKLYEGYGFKCTVQRPIGYIYTKILTGLKEQE